MDHTVEIRNAIGKLEVLSREARQARFTILEAKLEDIIADLTTIVEGMDVE